MLLPDITARERWFDRLTMSGLIGIRTYLWFVPQLYRQWESAGAGVEGVGHCITQQVEGEEQQR